MSDVNVRTLFGGLGFSCHFWAHPYLSDWTIVPVVLCAIGSVAPLVGEMDGRSFRSHLDSKFQQ